MNLIDLITRFYAISQGAHQFEMTDTNWSQDNHHTIVQQ